MSARVSDAAVTAAAEALLAASQTIETSGGLKIVPEMTIESAKRHIMAALVYSMGHYSHALLPAGWVEIDNFRFPFGAPPTN